MSRGGSSASICEQAQPIIDNRSKPLYAKRNGAGRGKFDGQRYSVEAAANWVTDFKPKIVYPYHYRNADGTKSDLTAFKTQVGGASDVRFLNWY